MAVDLHVHTNASDGSLSPDRVVEIAAGLGLTAIAITDHDTTDAVAEALAAGRRHNLAVVPGIELSTVFEQTSPHVLLYFVSPDEPRLVSLIGARRAARRRRLMAILERLEKLGVVITLDELGPDSDAPLGRFHIACAMLKKGLVNDIPDAFSKYLAEGRPAYQAIPGLEADEVVRVGRAIGAVSSLAHPGLSVDDRSIEKLAAAGLDGIEVVSSKHSPAERRHYLALARRLGLLVTGGSDCHGPSPSSDMLLGSVTLAEGYWRELLTAAAAKGVDQAYTP